jgi:branched-chain amino acid transport system ATP-binding protein
VIVIEVENLTVSYGGVVALDGISLNVRRGEIVALIGSNGAGKSTFLNALSGLIAADGGMIRFDGRNIVGTRAPHISRLGLLHVPEGRQILASLTVEDNLLLGKLALGGRQPDYDFDAVVALFPILAQRRKQAAGSLSGGEQQMLAIGRALMGAPKLLLLDEPSLGLAPIVVDHVFKTLQRINAAGLAILLVEQNAKRALEVSSRAFVLEQGRIAHEGNAKQLAADPEIARFYLGDLQAVNAR